MIDKDGRQVCPLVAPRHKPIEPFNVVDIRRLLAVAERSRYGALIDLAIRTGMRRGELLGLRWSDFDEEAGVLYVNQALHRITGKGLQFTPPKTGRSRRVVELSPFSMERLQLHRDLQEDERRLAGRGYQDHNLIFATSIGTPIDPANLRRAWDKIATEAELPALRFHDLRHASATFMLKQGTHPRIVMERLGHSSIRVTMDIYSHVMPGLQSQAARMLDTMLDGGELPLALPESGR
jgi:integrase